MSRRRNRGNRPPAGISLPGQGGQQAAPQFSRPVVIDQERLEIPDLKILLSIPQLANGGDEAAAVAMMPALIDMLERVVVGGLSGRPAGEFWALAHEALRQIGQAGNPKN